jgi:cyclopropane fatty-acyl-phospholipid synthase-like methyltransferase
VEKKKWDAKRTREALELGPDDVVAEIGPGLGIVASILASEVKALHLFDISSSFRAACKKHVTATNVHFHLMKPGDLSPLVGKGINKIYAEGVFIHFNLFDIYLYLKQIEFMLPHGGRFTFNIISSDYEGLLDDPVWQEQAEQYRCDKTRVFGLMSWLSPITVQKLLKRVGFLVADVTWPEQQYVHFTVIKP